MADDVSVVPSTKAWLVYRSGPLAGTRYPLADGPTRIGRNPGNDIVIQGPNTATVSGQHLEIFREEGRWRIRDTGSTNGTYLNGEKIGDADLSDQAIVQLGQEGPAFAFLLEEAPPAELDHTLVIPQGISLPQMRPATEASYGGQDTLLKEAVTRARRARMAGIGGQTLTIMRHAVTRALQRGHRRMRLTIYALTIALISTTLYGYFKIRILKEEKMSIDQRIGEIEAQLDSSRQTPEQTDRLISELEAYQGQAETLRHSLLYRVGTRSKEDFVTQEIRNLMIEFGAEVYSIPPEFVDRVNIYIHQYQAQDRPQMARALGEAAPKIATMQQILREEQLPPDFAYVPLVESALGARATSAAGAAGPWQFTAPTARAFGLHVDGRVDERYDLRKSTHAACGFLRQLLLDFGTGSSVMLALAAYNFGPTRVKQAVMNVVKDPIKQRNFWYLYRARALPAETREYVPKVFAAIIIGRNPAHFGF